MLPTTRHVRLLNKRASAPHAARPSARISTFADLIQRLAPRSGIANLQPAARRRAIEEICARRLTADSYFGKMRGIPGFAGAIGELIAELKLSGVTPSALVPAAEAAHRAGSDRSLLRKTTEIADIYADYQTFLTEHGFQDDEGKTLAAAESVRRGDGAAPATVLLDGFLRISRAWRMVLRALAESGTSVTITLTHEADRPLLFATTSRTLATLRDEFSVIERRFSPFIPPSLPPGLGVLERRLFSSDVIPAGTHKETAAEAAVRLFDTPNSYAEAEMVMRNLRRLHDESGIAWDDMLILLRAPAEYGTTLTSAAERFGVRLCVPQPSPLTEQPAAKALMALMRIMLKGWLREDVIAYLKSRSSGCARMEAEYLLRTARRRGVRDGLEGWLKLADESSEGARGCIRLVAEWQAKLQSAPAAPSAFALTLETMTAQLGIRNALSQGDSGGDQLSVLDSLLQTSRSMSEIQDRIGDRQITFEYWAKLVLDSWSAATFQPPGQDDSVIVADAYDARIRDARLTVVMGLTERAFPRRINEDPFFRDDERTQLRAAGLEGLEGRLERFDDERLLFYSAVTSCREQLILSYPRTGLEGDYMPSFFLDDVRAVVPEIDPVRMLAADFVPKETDCASDRDRLLREVAAMADRAAARASTGGPETPDSPTPEGLARYADSAGRPPLPRILDDTLRRSYRAIGRHNVSKLETYNRCPLQHFVKHAIRPETSTDGAGSADRGALYHRAINRAFRKRREQNQSGGPETEELLAELRRAETELPQDAALYRQGLRNRFLEDALGRFARRETSYAEAFDTRPTYFELAFGMLIETDETAPRDYDPESRAAPLELRSADGTRSVQLCGAIDRVDLINGSRAAMVMDYKTGSSPDIKKVLSGQSIQMPIYLQAVEEIWGLPGAVACYDSAREAARPRMFRVELAEMKRFGYLSGVDRGGSLLKPLNEEEYRSALDAARDAVFLAVDKMEACEIGPTPGDHCKFCDFTDFCRTPIDLLHDGEAFDISRESPIPEMG